MNYMFIIRTQLQPIHKDMMQLVVLKHKNKAPLTEAIPFHQLPLTVGISLTYSYKATSSVLHTVALHFLLKLQSSQVELYLMRTGCLL